MTKLNELDAAIDRYKCLIGICDNAQERSCSDPSSNFISKINLPINTKKVKNPKVEVNSYFDLLNQTLEDMCFLDIVASFEKMVFNSIGNASGEIKVIVKKGYKKPAAFHMAAESFVKKQDDIYNLSGVNKLITEKLPNKNSSELAEILEHRNWIAHGKRVGKQSTFSVTEVYESLNNIFELIHD